MHLAFTGFVLWRLAQVSCSFGSVLFWLRASGISLWLRAQVIALAGLSLGRHRRSLRCGGVGRQSVLVQIFNSKSNLTFMTMCLAP